MKKSSDKLNSIDHLAAGVEAGCIMVFLTNPLWLIKTRMQLQGADASIKKYNGTIG
jgi:solute carrier family 25 folate transporter 32